VEGVPGRERILRFEHKRELSAGAETGIAFLTPSTKTSEGHDTYVSSTMLQMRSVKKPLKKSALFA
jgi:hypothetical protein